MSAVADGNEPLWIESVSTAPRWADSSRSSTTVLSGKVWRTGFRGEPEGCLADVVMAACGSTGRSPFQARLSQFSLKLTDAASAW